LPAVGDDDLELVAAEAADLAAVADDRLQPLADLLEQLVAGRVAHRVVDLLEAVEVEHQQRARAARALVGREDRFDPPVHPVAIGEAGERIIFGEPRILDLALVFDGDVLGAAAVAVEAAGFVELRVARNRPPDRAPFAGRRRCEAHREVDQLVARAELGVERPFALGVVGVGLEQRDERLAEQLRDRPAELVGGVLRHVDQPSGGVARPDPADPGAFEVVEDLEPAPGIAGRDDRGLDRLGLGFRRLALQPSQQPPDRHSSHPRSRRPEPFRRRAHSHAPVWFILR
jgi:hypothetical protein